MSTSWGGLSGPEDGLLESLPSDLAEILRRRARLSRVKRGQIIIAEGSTATDVYYVVSGRMQVSTVSLAGREAIFRDVPAGRLIGEIAAIDGRARSATVVAIEDSVVAALAATEFCAYLAEVPKAGFWMAKQLSALVRDLSDRALAMATLPAGGRLIGELLRLPYAESADGARRDVARMPTHVELAAKIGTNRETITREMKKLAEMGLIVQRGRKLTIVSPQDLQQLLDRQQR